MTEDAAKAVPKAVESFMLKDAEYLSTRLTVDGKITNTNNDRSLA